MSHQISFIAIILLIIFAICRRVRRHIGWQLYKKRALIIRSSIFIIIGVLLLTGGIANSMVYLSDAIGLVIGSILAYIGLRTTEFQEQNERLYYRSNTWLGVALIAIVLGRIAYRFFVVYEEIGKMKASGGTPDQYNYSTYTSHPLTAGMIFILVAYYAVYYLFLIRKRNSHVNETHLTNL
jgi:hypothetical protein